MVVTLIVIGVVLMVAIAGYVFGSRYEVKIRRRTRVEVLDENDERQDNRH